MSNSEVIIFHNPKCSKSREALQLLNEKNSSIKVVEYLKNIPSKEELKEILKMLSISALDIMRKNEDEFKTHVKDKNLNENELIDLLIKFPKLIERPIVINNGKAVIGRPPALVLDIVD